ncbi:MAG: asparaginase domain-containing protein [Bdellovibrionales bacterium]
MPVTSKRSSHKRYLVLHMGGTIGMVLDKKTKKLRPPENTAEYEKSVTSIIGKFLKHHKHISFNFLRLSTADSNDTNAEMMEELSAIVHYLQNDYDGILITHGTDTLASTTAALNLAFQTPGGTSQLYTPIIVTGAQNSIHEVPTDAMSNLLLAFNAMLSLSNDKYFPGIYVAFGGLLIDGAHVIKAHESAYDAFQPTTRSALLGKADSHDKFGITFENIFESQGLAPARRKQHLLDATGPLSAGRFMLSPLDELGTPIFSFVHTIESSTFGSPKSYLPQAADVDCLGIVFKLTGIGSTSTKNFNPIKNIVNRHGIPVFGALGIAGGKADMSVYEIGNTGFESGLIPARGTSDAALVQLQWCLAQPQKKADLPRIAHMMSNYTSITSAIRNQTDRVLGSDHSNEISEQLPSIYNQTPTQPSAFAHRLHLSQQAVNRYRCYKGKTFRFLSVPDEISKWAGDYLPTSSLNEIEPHDVQHIHMSTGWARPGLH